jgi:hypothetical protein
MEFPLFFSGIPISPSSSQKWQSVAVAQKGIDASFLLIIIKINHSHKCDDQGDSLYEHNEFYRLDAAHHFYDP